MDESGEIMAMWIPWAACVIIGAALGYGAYTDAKTRTIPNIVPLVVLAAGFFTAGSLVGKLVTLSIFVVVFALISHMTKIRSGGGDVKLYMAIAFSLGAFSLVVILVLTMLLLKVADKVKGKKREKGERFPLCTYVFPAYLIYFFGYMVSAAIIAGR